MTGLREPIRRLLDLGPLPSEDDDVSDERIDEFAAASAAAYELRPLTGAEARALIPLFGRDTFWGIAWTLVHAIESAPVEEYEPMLPPAGTPQPEDADDWPARLRQRIENERQQGHGDKA